MTYGLAPVREPGVGDNIKLHFPKVWSILCIIKTRNVEGTGGANDDILRWFKIKFSIAI